MTKVEEAALREEIAELRKQLSALAVAIAELAVTMPYPLVQYVPYYPYSPLNPYGWQYPQITYAIHYETTCGSGVNPTGVSASSYDDSYALSGGN